MLREEFAAFRAGQSRELDEYALFAALKAAHGGAAWNTWEPALSKHDPVAIEQARSGQVADEYAFQTYAQWLFFRQWVALKQYANQHGVRIIGDIPIFVAYDSADVWANPELFFLDAAGNPTFIAGVPPDYFSATGHCGATRCSAGMCWPSMAMAGGSSECAQRSHCTTSSGSTTSAALRPTGRSRLAKRRRSMAGWAPGPGAALFSALELALGKLPIIAEDAGRDYARC